MNYTPLYQKKLLFYESKTNHYERKFFLFLQQNFSEKYFIVPQVHILSLLKPHSKVMDDNTWLQTCRNRSVDFVLYDKITFFPLLAIEVQGPSHKDPKKSKHDKEKAELLKQGGMKLIYFEGKNEYGNVEKKILEELYIL